MVQVLKNNKGFTLSEILVATIILSIAALAFVATIQSTTKMGKQATTNDAAYSIARQRLALMQDGELLVRQNYVDSTERDNLKYYTLDEVVYGTADLPAKLTITVSWKTPSEKSISLTGYLNRDICPEEVNDLAEVDLQISNVTIPEDAPSNTEVGELKVIDPNNINLHMFLYPDNAASDNHLFKVEKGKLFTSAALTMGEKKVILVVEDCAGTRKEFTLLIDVTAKDEVPNIEDQEFAVDEDATTGFQIAKVYATPLNVVYSIVSQEPVPALSIGNDGILVVGSASSLDYEANPVITLKVEAWNTVNDEYKDTAVVTVKVNDVNEAPHDFIYSGVEVIEVGMSPGTFLGKFAVNDTDAGDNSHNISLSGAAFPYLRVNNLTTPRTLHVGLGTLAGNTGTYEAVLTATDGGGLSIEKKLLITIVDPSVSEGCGTYHEYISGYTYNNGDQAYLADYIYQAKWWTQSKPAVSNSDWEFIGACSGNAVCSDFPDFANGRDYNAGNMVTHANGVYKATTYSKNVTPTESSTKWKKVSTCSN